MIGIMNCFLQTYAVRGNQLQPLPDILIFVAATFFIGLTEEILCRGIISNLIFDAYGKTKEGVKYSVIISGILFGLFHLSNLASGSIEVKGVLIQVVATSAMGMLFTAIYYRTRNLWVVIFLHAFIDFAALISSGVYQQGTITDTISSYTVVNLISIVPMLIATMYLLRSDKTSQMIEEVHKDDVIEQRDTNIFDTNIIETNKENEKLTSKYHGALVGYIAVVGLIAVILR